MTYNVLCISNNVTYKINYFDYIHFFLIKINPNLNHCMQNDNNMKLIDIIKVKFRDILKFFYLDYSGLIILIKWLHK